MGGTVIAAYNKFNAFVGDLATKTHNLSSDVCKVMLTNTVPLAANAVKADITEIAAGNGYSAGGTTATNTESASAGTATVSGTMVTFTASGAGIGPFRYAVIYNSTPAAGPLIAWWDYGSALTLGAGESLQVQFNGSLTTGTIFTLT